MTENNKIAKIDNTELNKYTFEELANYIEQNISGRMDIRFKDFLTKKESPPLISAETTESERLKVDKRNRRQREKAMTALQHLITYALILLATLL